MGPASAATDGGDRRGGCAAARGGGPRVCDGPAKGVRCVVPAEEGLECAAPRRRAPGARIPAAKGVQCATPRRKASSARPDHGERPRVGDLGLIPLIRARSLRSCRALSGIHRPVAHRVAFGVIIPRTRAPLPHIRAPRAVCRLADALPPHIRVPERLCHRSAGAAAGHQPPQACQGPPPQGRHWPHAHRQLATRRRPPQARRRPPPAARRRRPPPPTSRRSPGSWPP